MNDHGDYEWRFRWWLADTLKPLIEIALAGLVAAGAVGAVYQNPAALPLLLLAAMCAYAQHHT